MNEITLELFKNEAFMKKVCFMSAEDAQKEFAAKGSDITVEQLNAIAEEARKMLENGDELDEEALDDVTGGKMSGWQMFKFCAGVAIGIVAVTYPW